MAMFARRHYEVLVSVFRASRPPSGAPAERESQWLVDRRNVAQMLERDNPGFDSEKFYKAVDKIDKSVR